MYRNHAGLWVVAVSYALAAFPVAMRAGTPLTTVRVAANLSNPVFVTHAPNDYSRLFIVEQRGKIKILKNGQVLPTPFLDVSTLVSLGGEQGLLGLAFHPDYETNGQFFIHYTNHSADVVIARHKVSAADPDVAEEIINNLIDIIMVVDHPFANHNGGWIGFGPSDGYLYIAIGDGGSQADPNGRGQSKSGELLGNILRIDVSTDWFLDDEFKDYAIPPANPFVGQEGDDEIWAYGLRNPWRCAFDRLTGDLWIADVGETMWEEVNFQPASSNGGENYGWNCREGRTCTTFGKCDCDALQSVLPIHEYSHGQYNARCSITGGEVYRGCEIPDLQGTYFFADFCSGQIWSLTYNGTIATVVDRTVELAPAGGTISSISSFGRDAAGEIYICDRNGTNSGEVYKIVPATGLPRFQSSDPPDRAVDARTPLGEDGVTPVGMNQVTLRFNAPTNCTAEDLFTVVQEGKAGDPPQIADIQRSGNDLVVTLDQPIHPLSWTIITHLPTQASVRLGFLPGDVNGNLISGPSDILDLVDALNGVGPARPIWSLDVDRSGLAAPADILMLVDLLNGAGNLDSYLGAQLP